MRAVENGLVQLDRGVHALVKAGACRQAMVQHVAGDIEVRIIDPFRVRDIQRYLGQLAPV